MDNKKIAIDAAATTLIFWVACFVGVTAQENRNSFDSCFSFIIPAIGTFVLGLLIWLWIRKINWR